MRPNRLRLRGIAAWLGLVALGCNALAPVHLAFGFATHLADARECGHNDESGAVRRGSGWWLLALLTGQDDTSDPSRSHGGLHPGGSGACVLIGTPTGFTPAAAAMLAPPDPLNADRFAVVAAEPQSSAAPSVYRSRAPPGPDAEPIR
jgi:hypothetical protein